MPGFGSHLTGPIRHTTSLRNQAQRAWYRDQPIGMNDPDFVHHFIDFVKISDYSVIAGDYTLSSSGTGGSVSVNSSATYVTGNLGSSAASVNGMLQMQSGSTAGNYIQVQNKTLAWQLDRTAISGGSLGNTLNIQDMKNLWFEAAFSADVSASDVDCFIGLSEIGASIVGGGGTTNNYIGFRIANGAATIKYVASTGGTVTTGTTSLGSGNSVTHTQGSLTKVGFVFSGSNNVDFYINRNYMNSFAIGSCPTAPLAIAVELVTNAATNRSLVLDYVLCSKVR